MAKQPDYILNRGSVHVNAFVNDFGDNKSIMISLSKTYRGEDGWESSNSYTIEEARDIQEMIDEIIAHAVADNEELKELQRKDRVLKEIRDKASNEVEKEEPQSMSLGQVAAYAAGVIFDDEKQTMGKLETRANGALKGIRISNFFILEQNKNKKKDDVLTHYAQKARDGHKILWIYKTTPTEDGPKEGYYAKYVDGKVSKA